MNLKKSAAHAALATVFILSAMHLWPGKALAQEDMKGMPGMAPTATRPTTPWRWSLACSFGGERAAAILARNGSPISANKRGASLGPAAR